LACTIVPSRSTATMASGRASRRSLERRTSVIVLLASEGANCLTSDGDRDISTLSFQLQVCQIYAGTRLSVKTRTQVVELKGNILSVSSDVIEITETSDCDHYNSRVPLPR